MRGCLPGRVAAFCMCPPDGIRKGASFRQGSLRVIRLLGSFFGGIFTMVTLGLFFAALTVGAVFHMYTRDLPSHESLAQYMPPTISRIYSGEGGLMDEFAKERRLYMPIEEIPDLVKHAFIGSRNLMQFLLEPAYEGGDIDEADRAGLVRVLDDIALFLKGSQMATNGTHVGHAQGLTDLS